MDDFTYVCTKRVRMQGGSLVVIIPHDWPFKKGDSVVLGIRKMGGGNMHVVRKAVSKSGTSLCVGCSKRWDIQRNDMVLFTLRLDGDVKDSGRKIETVDSGISEV